METAIIIFHIHKEHRTVDLEVPLDLTAKNWRRRLTRRMVWASICQI